MLETFDAASFHYKDWREGKVCTDHPSHQSCLSRNHSRRPPPLLPLLPPLPPLPPPHSSLRKMSLKTLLILLLSLPSWQPWVSLLSCAALHCRQSRVWRNLIDLVSAQWWLQRRGESSAAVTHIHMELHHLHTQQEVFTEHTLLWFTHTTASLIKI